jgi:hypothetical protein
VPARVQTLPILLLKNSGWREFRLHLLRFTWHFLATGQAGERNSSQSFQNRFALTHRLPGWLILMKETIPDEARPFGANHPGGFQLICQICVICEAEWLVGSKTLTLTSEIKLKEFKGLSDSSRFLQ